MVAAYAVAVHTSGSPFFAIDTWFKWDGGHYFSIADTGYVFHDCAGIPGFHPGQWCGNAGWFPGYPYFVRGVHLLTGADTKLLALYVSQAFAVVSLFLVWNLFLCWVPVAAALSAGCVFREVLAAGDPEPKPEATEKQIHDYLRPLLLKSEDVDHWLKQQAFPFCKYDPELGYLHIDRDFPEGLDGAVCQYRYDALDARRMFAYAGEPCRINSYGDSYTSCEQVSDGETWQESLAAHLGEPIRNYGIGAYSVYQAYLRMLREEKRAPARYIIFNLFHDDHVRNLHGWQRFKFGVNRKSPSPIKGTCGRLDKGDYEAQSVSQGPIGIRPVRS
jgi:hypothetical protein